MPQARCPQVNGEALREARKRNGLSQVALGRLCGEKYLAPMAGRNVGQIEAGANPTPARRVVLELTLGLQIGSLLSEPPVRQDIPRPATETSTPTRAAAA
jgi:hypothetical protein